MGSKRGDVFRRGTDRGAVTGPTCTKGGGTNTVSGCLGRQGCFDLAFLDDDLLNATAVNTGTLLSPWLVRPDRYLLDFPGKGYSVSLPQKRTSSSAVFLSLDRSWGRALDRLWDSHHDGLRRVRCPAPCRNANLSNPHSFAAQSARSAGRGRFCASHEGFLSFLARARWGCSSTIERT